MVGFEHQLHGDYSMESDHQRTMGPKKFMESYPKLIPRIYPGLGIDVPFWEFCFHHLAISVGDEISPINPWNQREISLSWLESSERQR